MSWFTRAKKPSVATDPVAPSDSPAPIEFGDPLDLAIARGARQYEVDRAEALFFARHGRLGPRASGLGPRAADSGREA